MSYKLTTLTAELLAIEPLTGFEPVYQRVATAELSTCRQGQKEISHPLNGAFSGGAAPIAPQGFEPRNTEF